MSKITSELKSTPQPSPLIGECSLIDRSYDFRPYDDLVEEIRVLLESSKHQESER